MRANLTEANHEFLEIYFFNPSEFEKSGAAWPIRLGYNIAKPNYHIGPRMAPYFYLMFVIEGKGTLLQGDQIYTLQANDIYCLLPHVTHEYYTEKDRLLSKLFIAFDGKHALTLLDRLGLSRDQPHLANVLTPALISLMWSFLELANSSRNVNTDLARLSLFQRIFDQLAQSVQPVEKADRSHLTWLQKGKEYLEIHYADGITVDKVAGYVGVDRTNFTKQFHRAYGVTPIQYIQDLRMNEAKILLSQTHYRVSEIAQSVGYPDLFSFSKAFKRIVGLPPNQYRKGC